MGAQNFICLESRKPPKDLIEDQEEFVQHAYSSDFAFTVRKRESRQCLAEFAQNFDVKDKKMKKSLNNVQRGISKLQSKTDDF